MARVSGRIEISYDGKRMRGVGSFKVNPGKDRNEVLVGADGVHGHKTMPQAPSIEGEVRKVQGFAMEEFLTAQSMSALIIAADGTKYSLSDGVNTTEGILDLEEGTLPIKIEGGRMEIK